ncbi:Hypothetical predicted protein [Mytilus galloprovincialis]|uniref:Uncharacterized protein n=1 Tax=Mytilus galloprovincialis TaxID=29158 RepID=A0A8B6E715_MYTGA|nr:Hypothetical predicted protein [Mytilus galloprovincialis]
MADQNELILSIASSVKEIKEGQDSMKRMFESKIDKLRNDVLSTIDEKMRALKCDIDIDLARESTRIDELVNSVQLLTTRLGQVENDIQSVCNPMNDENVPSGHVDPSIGNVMRSARVLDPLNNNDVTVIVKNVPFNEEENLSEKVTEIISCLGENISSNVKVAATLRIKARFHNKPGLVKVSFQNAEQKIMTLRNKHKLKNSENHSRVFIQGAKSYIERLLETNARTILRELPQGKSYRISGNGRILKKTTENEQIVDNAEMETYQESA